MFFFLMNSDAVSKYQLFLSAKLDDQGILPESIKNSYQSHSMKLVVLVLVKLHTTSKSNYIDILKWNHVEINQKDTTWIKTNN